MPNLSPEDSNCSISEDTVLPAVLISIEDIEKQRKELKPPQVTRGHKRIIAVFLILANSILFLSFGAAMGGGFSIGESFGADDPTTAAWIAAAYPLTQGAFVLVTGRIGAVYGHKNILLIGGAWWILWTLINGFCTKSIISFAIARACSGIGAAMAMPNIVAIIGITFPPGKMRNLTLGFMGFAAPVGGTIGCLLIGLFIECTQWNYFFFTIAILGTIIYTALWMVLVPESPVDKKGNIDWFGAFLGLSALILFNFVWNQAPAVGWSTNYEITLLLGSILLFALFGFWEQNLAKQPIMPLNIWVAPSFFALIIVVMFSVMAYGIALWHLVAWQQLVRHWTVLQFAAGLIPHAIFGGCAAPIAAWLIPRLAAQWILAFGALSVLLSAALLATMPAQQSYWAQVFPSTILMALCPDFIFTAAQIIATNSVRRHEQGIAGSLMSLLLLYSASIGLGFAGTVEANVNSNGAATLDGYRGALYLATGLGTAALIIDILFVRVPKDEREGWGDEDGLSAGS